ncbi:hypothetical protein Zm00014a_023020 [Zea mays]|uniref:Uncharacterized protein n=2 Tax=Zea mays TaxID=4577 RepID=K7W1W5_MAIZE|nr:uncharacterized protein LOC100275348 [Zea mays]AQK98419.1 hypothetical protein ZEAMMB73_Zm00001d011968 [Zea mays]PWZ08906.1 hypothetical protein Zm00014a_023020 [Zea mays]|eukprot:NP_001336118.1 uncharacterized protein LOC100275348 [Zea mays]
MGCAASAANGAGPRRRGWARARMRRYSEASTSGLPPPPPPPQEAAESSSGGRRRGRKVAPEPKEPAEEGTAALPPMPGSPSFRYYCQKKTAAVDRIVADADAADADDSVRVRATARQLSNRCEITATKAHDSTEVAQPKEGTRWLRFSGLSLVATAWHNLISRQRSKHSPPPAAATSQP